MRVLAYVPDIKTLYRLNERVEIERLELDSEGEEECWMMHVLDLVCERPFTRPFEFKSKVDSAYFGSLRSVVSSTKLDSTFCEQELVEIHGTEVFEIARTRMDK